MNELRREIETSILNGMINELRICQYLIKRTIDYCNLELFELIINNVDNKNFILNSYTHYIETGNLLIILALSCYPIFLSMLKHGLNPNIKDRFDSTPLVRICKFYNNKYGDYDQFINALIEYGADPTIPEDNGLNAIDYARRHGRFDLPFMRDRSVKSAKFLAYGRRRRRS
jgi:ankyrin repeat protein